jgi:hypothetical protein
MFCGWPKSSLPGGLAKAHKPERQEPPGSTLKADLAAKISHVYEATGSNWPLSPSWQGCGSPPASTCAASPRASAVRRNAQGTVTGVETLGTQVLVYGFQSNYFTTNARCGRCRLVRQRRAAGRRAGPDHRRLAGRRGHRRFHRLLHLRRSRPPARPGHRPGPRQRKLEEAEHKVEKIAGAAQRNT